MKCKGKWAYAQPRIREYQRAYAQRPERREAARLRSRARYATEEYRTWARERWRRLFGDRFADTEIPVPYTGHRWFDMARAVVGSNPSPEYRDFGYDDEVGEAVLALLEGRDMDEAVREFRRQEYIPRHLTRRQGDYLDDEGVDRWFDRLMPTVESAEDEVVAAETISYELAARMRWHRNSVRGLHAARRKGSRGPNRSFERFRGKRGEGRRGREEYAA